MYRKQQQFCLRRCLYLHVHLRIDRPVLLTTNLSEHTFVCEIMQEYVRALIGVLSVYWLEFIFNCALFDNVLFFACLRLLSLILYSLSVGARVTFF